MKVSLDELLLLGIQFKDGDTYCDGKRLRRGQYFGEITSLEALRDGLYVNSKQVFMRDIIDAVNDLRIKGIRLMWDDAVCIGQYEGKTIRGSCPEAVLLAYECDGGHGELIKWEGKPGTSLSETHRDCTHKLRSQVGFHEDTYYMMLDVTLVTGQFYCQKGYPTPLEMNETDVVGMIGALLPGLKGLDIKAECIDLKIKLGDREENLWEFLT